MVTPPITAVQLLQRGIGEQVNGALKQMHGVAARGWNMKGKALIAPGCLTFEVSACTAQMGISGLSKLVLPDEHDIVIWQALIQPSGVDAEPD